MLEMGIRGDEVPLINSRERTLSGARIFGKDNCVLCSHRVYDDV